MDKNRTVCSVITTFIGEYQRAPFDFLYERDIQAVLFTRLYDAFRSHRLRLAGGHYSLEDYGAKFPSIDTVPVHCEIGDVFDISMIDERNLIGPSKSNDTFWNQSVNTAIELKYHQLTDRIDIRKAGFAKDFKKLKSYERDHPGFLGMALLFIQSHRPAVFESISRGFSFDAAGTRLTSIIEKSDWRGVHQIVVTPTNTYEMHAQ